MKNTEMDPLELHAELLNISVNDLKNIKITVKDMLDVLNSPRLKSLTIMNCILSPKQLVWLIVEHVVKSQRQKSAEVIALYQVTYPFSSPSNWLEQSFPPGTTYDQIYQSLCNTYKSARINVRIEGDS